MLLQRVRLDDTNHRKRARDDGGLLANTWCALISTPCQTCVDRRKLERSQTRTSSSGARLHPAASFSPPPSSTPEDVASHLRDREVSRSDSRARSRRHRHSEKQIHRLPPQVSPRPSRRCQPRRPDEQRSHKRAQRQRRRPSLPTHHVISSVIHRACMSRVINVRADVSHRAVGSPRAVVTRRTEPLDHPRRKTRHAPIAFPARQGDDAQLHHCTRASRVLGLRESARLTARRMAVASVQARHVRLPPRVTAE